MGKMLLMSGADFSDYKIASDTFSFDGSYINDISEIIVGTHFGDANDNIAHVLTTTTNRATTTDVLNTSDFVGKKIYIPSTYLITKVQATALTQIYSDVKSTDPGWQTPNASGYVEFDFDSDYQYLIFTIKKTDNSNFTTSDIADLKLNLKVM